MSRRLQLFLLFAAVAALVCVRLGVWQLSRLNERRARNAILTTRLDSAVVPASELPPDTSLARYRAVRVSGTYDYANEHYVTGRSHQGSPGVHIITPLRNAAGDSAVPVNRGWVYAPDAMAAPDPDRWREGDSVRTVTGFVETFPAPLAGRAVLDERPRSLRWLDPRAFAARASYAIAPFYVVARDSTPSARRDSTPVRILTPTPNEGSHLSYAIQWFSFAVIAVGGAALFVVGQRKTGSRD